MASFNKSKNEEIKPNSSWLIDPFIEIRSDICPICKAQRIELFSFNGYPQNYRDAVDAHLRGYNISYDMYEIKYMRCKSCNREFIIDWSFYDKFPRPLIDASKVNRFLNEFVSGI